MKIYKVGGAVRDRLLGIKVTDIDRVSQSTIVLTGWDGDRLNIARTAVDKVSASTCCCTAGYDDINSLVGDDRSFDEQLWEEIGSSCSILTSWEASWWCSSTCS